MSDKNTKESGFSGILAAAVIGLLVALVVVLSFALFYLEFTGLSIADGENPSGYLGTLGDFIGGVLNPIAAVLSVGLLAYTLHQNSVALNITRKELEKQAKATKEMADNSKLQANLFISQLEGEREKLLDAQFINRFDYFRKLYSEHSSRILLGEMTVNDAISKHKNRPSGIEIYVNPPNFHDVGVVITSILPLVVVLRFQIRNTKNHISKVNMENIADIYGYMLFDIGGKADDLYSLMKRMTIRGVENRILYSDKFETYKVDGHSLKSISEDIEEILSDVESLYGLKTGSNSQ